MFTSVIAIFLIKLNALHSAARDSCPTALKHPLEKTYIDAKAPFCTGSVPRAARSLLRLERQNIKCALILTSFEAMTWKMAGLP